MTTNNVHWLIVSFTNSYLVRKQVTLTILIVCTSMVLVEIIMNFIFN